MENPVETVFVIVWTGVDSRGPARSRTGLPQVIRSVIRRPSTPITTRSSTCIATLPRCPHHPHP